MAICSWNHGCIKHNLGFNLDVNIWRGKRGWGGGGGGGGGYEQWRKRKW